MKKIITTVVLLVGLTLHAQDKDRFNIGLHYRPPVGNELTDFAGGFDLRVRAISVGVANFGVGMSATYRVSNYGPYQDFVMLNPHLYAEFEPFKFKLRPYFNVGYMTYNQKLEFYTGPSYVPDPYDPAFYHGDTKIESRGYTLAAGARFDFAKFLYCDVGLVYVSVNTKDPTYYYAVRKDSYGMLNAGFGFRF